MRQRTSMGAGLAVCLRLVLLRHFLDSSVRQYFSDRRSSSRHRAGRCGSTRVFGRWWRSSLFTFRNFGELRQALSYFCDLCAMQCVWDDQPLQTIMERGRIQQQPALRGKIGAQVSR
jgi:hypothetical protein